MLGSENIWITDLKDKMTRHYELRHKYVVAISRRGQECDEENTGRFEKCVDDAVSRAMKCHLPWIKDETYDGKTVHVVQILNVRGSSKVETNPYFRPSKTM